MKLTPEIQTTLANVELAIVGQTLGLRLPAGLDRALYVKANKALEALGGKWNRGAKAPRASLVAARTRDVDTLAAKFRTSPLLMRLHLERLGLIERTKRGGR